MIGLDDTVDILLGELAVNAVDEGAHFPGVDEEGLAPAVADELRIFGVRSLYRAGGFISSQEPEADGDLGGVEELAGECDHAVYEVCLDEGFSDLAFAGLVRGHGAIREDEAGHAIRREVVDEVLDPGEVRIPLRRDAVLPADVVVFAEPVGVVEGGIGQDEVSP